MLKLIMRLYNNPTFPQTNQLQKDHFYGQIIFKWYRRWESNPHSLGERDFESRASTNSATSAY